MASSGHDFELKTEGFVVADTGDVVTLLCHLSPNISAVSMTIRWFKETKCIYVYKNGQVKKGRGYEDRLSLVTQKPKIGNVSLRLRSFRESDVGVYICQVIHGEQEQETAVGLWTRTCLDSQLVFSPQAGPLDTTTSSTIRPEARPGPLDTTTSSTIRPEARHSASIYLKKETAQKKLQRIRSAELLERELFKKEHEKYLEMEKKLTACEEELKQKDATLNQRETELQEAENKLKITTLELNDLKTEVERLRNELSALKTGGAESPHPESTLPMRRRWSLEWNPPTMGVESSTPDSQVSPRVSELRLLLLGRTEAGRSAAGNTILDREEFVAQASPSAESQRSRRREGDVCGRRLVLVDTPDWFCPELSLEEMRQDVGLYVHLSAPGPHAFLLVIPVDPSEEKEEERGMMERMEEMFGEGCWGNTVILFTHADSLTQQSIEEFLQAGSPDLQQLVEKCGDRYHVLNIKNRAQGTQVSELLDQIEEMVSGNTQSFYSSQIFLEAETQAK